MKFEISDFPTHIKKLNPNLLSYPKSRDNSTLTEADEQELFVNYLTAKGIKHTAILNEIYTTSWAQKNRQKRVGLHAGIPDILLILEKNNKKYLVFIEMKRRDLKPKRGGKGGVRENQREWIDALEECEGVFSFVAWGARDAVKIVEKF